jgi:recombination protein RecR
LFFSAKKSARSNIFKPMNFSSKLIENAVNAFATLPGIGRKSALRMVLHLLKQETGEVIQFSQAIQQMREEIKFCTTCHNVSDGAICGICANHYRNAKQVCIVESIRDVIAIENTGQYNGVYHVLGGIISPIDGIGPDELNIESLIERVAKIGIEEVIMALNPTVEGDTTIYYISKRLKEFNINITSIARGVAFGGELEYVDEFTLARSLATRLPYENYLVNK